MTTPPIENKVAIRSFLLDGWCASDIAKKLGISRQAVAKHIRRYVREGIIVPISTKPIHYARKIHDNPPLGMPLGFDNQATILPHHYGGVFAVVGKLNLTLDDYGKWHEKKPGYTIQLGRYKAQLWIKSFPGISPQEIRERANKALLALANDVGLRFQITLSLIKIYTNIEWAMTDQETSDKIADSLGLKKEEEILVDNVRHKNGDASHTTMEFIPTEANPTGASKHADAHHFVYSGLMARTFEALGDAVITINQRLMKLEAKP